MAGKAPVARAVTYPLWSFAIPVAWAVLGRNRAFPVVPDALVTLTCFTDILGNRLELYDRVVWFDDGMHFLNVALLCGALLLLTTDDTTPPVCVLERAVAFGTTAALTWELYEYVGFVTRSAELTSAYADTLGDLALGWGGAVVAGLALAARHHRGARQVRACVSWPHGLHGRDQERCHTDGSEHAVRSRRAAAR
jgi:hypothetical protein